MTKITITNPSEQNDIEIKQLSSDAVTINPGASADLEVTKENPITDINELSGASGAGEAAGSDAAADKAAN